MDTPERQPSPDESKKARGALQPNSRSCFVCGLENPGGLHLRFYKTGEGQVEGHYVVPEQFQGYPGVVHGGIVASMLDELVGRAAMTCNPDQFWVTAKLIVRYRKPIPVGKPLHLIGQLKRMSGSRTVSHAEIRLKDGSLGAEAEATLIKSPALDLSERELEALGWKVYPEDS